MSPFRAFVRKEVRHILRDRQTLAILLLLPVAMVLLFGYAIRTDVTDVRVVVADSSRDAEGTRLAQFLASSTALQLVGVLDDPGAAEPELRAGRADVAVVLPTDFARGLRRGTAEVLVLSDGMNANYSSTAEAYVRNQIQAYVAESGGGARAQPVGMAVRMRFNPTLASENLFVPGLLAFVLTLVSALMTAITLAREKETGTMEVLLVSPLRPLQIVAGKVAPYLVLAFVNALVALGLAWVVFGVPVKGSLALLLVAAFVFVLVSLALGVLISTRTPDQRSAMMATLLGLMIPTITLSGFIFPVSSLPFPLSALSNAVPATYFISVARGVMLKGVGLDYLWPDLLVLCGMAAGLLLLSARTLNERLA